MVRVGLIYSNSRNGAAPFFAIITQRDHKYATRSRAKQFYVFLATAPTDVLTAEIRKTKFMGKVLHIYGKKRRSCNIVGITALQNQARPDYCFGPLLPSIDEARLAEDENVQGVQDVAAPDRDHEHVAPLGREGGERVLFYIRCIKSNEGFMAVLQ